MVARRPFPSAPPAFTIRDGLASQTRAGYARLDSAGRLEVFDSGSGRWGTVCITGWDERDTRVACRQFGFSNVSLFLSTRYAVGSGSPIHLSNVNCIGSETFLLACQQKRIGINTCSHSQDFTIVCTSPAVGEYIPCLTLHHVLT